MNPSCSVLTRSGTEFTVHLHQARWARIAPGFLRRRYAPLDILISRDCHTSLTVPSEEVLGRVLQVSTWLEAAAIVRSAA